MAPGSNGRTTRPATTLGGWMLAMRVPAAFAQASTSSYATQHPDGRCVAMGQPFGAMMACCLAALAASGGGAWRLLRRR